MTQPPGEIGQQRAAPQFQQLAHAGLLGSHRGQRNQETFCEQLALGQKQGDETNAECQSGQELVSGGMFDGEIGHDAQAHLHPAKHPP